MDLWRLMHGYGIRRGCGSIGIEAFVGIWREAIADILTVPAMKSLDKENQ